MIEPFNCREVASLLTEYRERTIPWNLRIRTWVHLRLCPGCHRLLLELESLASIFQRFEPSPTIDLQPIGRAALANAMGRLGGPRPVRRPVTSPIPPSLLDRLTPTMDLPLRLMAQAHAALARGEGSLSEPFLPDAILSQLPPIQEWTWRRQAGGIRRALLCEENGGPSLFLVHMPPGFTSPSHVHHGSESILVLEGELEHDDRCLTDGDWIHLGEGSSHAPCAFGRGCWCLVRDEGTTRYGGFLGWFRSLRPGA